MVDAQARAVSDCAEIALGPRCDTVTAVPGFNVCLPQPEGYQHSFCLLELSELLTFSLQDLGYDATFSINDVYPDRRNVLIGCHLLPTDLIAQMPESTIVVNTEQIYDEDRFGWNTNIFTWVRTFETWDYSPRNVAAFERLGLPGVKLLRIGHQPQLTRIPKAADQDIDVLFYGSVTDRRQVIFDQIRARGLNLVTLFGVYGAERDAYISRSKVVLTLHNHASEIFEVVRVHYLLSNAVAVVGEVNASTAISDYYADAIAGVPYESVAAECERLVNDAAARKAQEERGYELISRHPQTEFTRAVLS